MEFLSDFLPRLVSDLNTSSVLLFLVVVTLWRAYVASNERYIKHLESTVDGLTQERLIKRPVSSSSADELYTASHAPGGFAAALPTGVLIGV